MDAVGWHDDIAKKFADAYSSSALFRERFDIWSELIGRHVPSGSVVLDAGCGPGFLSVAAAKIARRVVGVDASRQMLEIAVNNAARAGCTNVDFIEMSLESPTLCESGPFDVILCSSVLEYFADFRSLLANFSNALAEGGTIAVSVPNRTSAYRKLERLVFRLTGRPRYYAHVAHTWTAPEMRSQMEACGLEVQRVVYYGTLPFLSRLVRTLGAPQLGDLLFVTIARKTAAERRP